MTNLLPHRTILCAFFALAPLACGGSTVQAPIDNGTDTSVSGDSTSEGGGDSLADGSDGSDDTVVTDSTGTDSPGDAPGDTNLDAPKACSTEATRALCTACCGTRHPEGLKTFDAAVIGCGCATTVCGTECAATVCSTPPKKADATCTACLAAAIKAGVDGGTGGACVGPVTSACSGSAGCKAYVACVETCPT